MANNLSLFKSKLIFILVCVSMFIGLFLLPGDVADARLGKELWNMLHLAAFFVLWLFLVNQFNSLRPDTLFSIIKIILITLIASVIIETIQYFIGRSASLKDIGLNLAGTLFALIVTIQINRYFKGTSYYLNLSMIVIAGILLWPSARIFIDETQRRLDFPVLADFSRSFEIGRWSSNSAKVEIIKTDIGNVLDVTLLPRGKYPGISVQAISTDWGKYRELVIVVVNNNDTTIPLTIRIHDALHNNQFYDRYNRSREIPVGLSTITVNLLDLYKAPKDRKMDLSNIRAIGLFATDLKSEVNFKIKRVYLH